METQDWTCITIPDRSVDTVTLVATWNYLSDAQRELVLRAAHRMLARYGRLVVTCLTPLGTAVLRLWDGLAPWGARPAAVLAVVERAGFRAVYHRPFQGGFNHLYVFGKVEVTG